MANGPTDVYTLHVVILKASANIGLHYFPNAYRAFGTCIRRFQVLSLGKVITGAAFRGYERGERQ